MMENQTGHDLNQFPRDLGRNRQSAGRAGRNRKCWHLPWGAGPSQHSM